MTISATTAFGTAIGTGITGPYSIPFVLYNQSDLLVVTAIAGVPTPMVLGVDYTFTSFVVDLKGQCASPAITFTNPVAGGVLIAFILDPTGEQLTAISNFAAYFPNLQEAALDKVAQKTLQLQQGLSGAIQIPNFEDPTVYPMALPAAAIRAKGSVGFDSNGKLVVAPNAFSVPSALNNPVVGDALVFNGTVWVNAAKIVQTFTPSRFSVVGTDGWCGMGCKITIAPGTWRLTGTLSFQATGTGRFTEYAYGFFSSDGANSGVKPNALVGSIKAGFSGNLGFDQDGTTTNIGKVVNPPEVIIAVSVSSDIYLVPFVTQAVSSNGLVIDSIINAERISLVTS